MKATLIGITQPKIAECKTAEELIAYAAKVSNPANQANHDTAPRLLKYLVKHHHWSPFEMVSLTIGIDTTRDIARQILRHRSFSFQEFSQRYAVAQNFVLRDARLQDSKNRQASNETDDEHLKALWEDAQNNILDIVQTTYSWALDAGIAKEQARAILPEGLTGSSLYMAGTLRSWIHYINLRTAWDTQKEHREVAEACKAIIIEEFPSLSEVLSND